ncbi:MAG: antibiotic biosynthesis monooxygenase family protein [Vulcanimicrobiaceae bacterium]
MFSVIFEVQPKDGRFDEYLGYAKLLKPEIERIDGFIDNERFASRRDPGRVLSHSTWRDEKALIRWRTLAVHHEIQAKGRFEVFTDYHLRVGEIVADTHVPLGQTLRQQRFDETEIGRARVVTIAEIPPEASSKPAESHVRSETPAADSVGLIEVELFESIYNPGKVLVLSSWRDESALAVASRLSNGDAAIRRRTIRVIRDYGMFDRQEAPQYFAGVTRSKP